MTEEEMKKWFENCKDFEQANNMGNYIEEMYRAFLARIKSEYQLIPQNEDKS